MQIVLENCGRRFNREWIFRNLSYTFDQKGKYAILGPNGSGKSTLMSVILGSLSPSEGKIGYEGLKEVTQENAYQHISFSAPYLELIEDFTLAETIRFHFSFKSYGPNLGYETVLDALGLAKAEDKPLKYFSSGMKQRTKLALAFCSETPVVLLDEPTANLDTQGIEWYLRLVDRFSENKLFIVASNQEHEYGFCHNLINISDYKAPHSV